MGDTTLRYLRLFKEPRPSYTVPCGPNVRVSVFDTARLTEWPAQELVRAGGCTHQVSQSPYMKTRCIYASVAIDFALLFEMQRHLSSSYGRGAGTKESSLFSVVISWQSKCTRLLGVLQWKLSSSICMDGNILDYVLPCFSLVGRHLYQIALRRTKSARFFGML